MSGIVATDDSAASTAGMRDDDGSVSGESLPEWRPYEQVENESPSTSPPFWDTDGDDDDPGPKPSDLFGRYTWRIEKFSKEKKREMKSEPFEAGGYKWYILVYPQGCDVSNHLSLFLCVANHDKLLPGWSHFAQFTIAVGNVDPKKIKYSDTLHRFWKKEHDWGWKKFMELSKIQDGFLVDDVLEIIAQVQVIREKADRPFRCLDRPYRRELLCVYMTNIEQIYRRFVEERRSKLSKLIEDKMRWSSFRAFWLAIDPSTRHRMSREKTDAILRVMVKHFFVEKEVTSTLVMDSLYMGLKALEYQSRGKKGRTKVVDLEELPAPMVHVDMDMFVLAGDVIALLERAALEPLPCQPVSPKDDKCSQSRTKDGGSGEVNKISIEREERRLTELGQKILETFVLSHIFSGIEVAYQEAVALKRQEELIREEEAAGLLENEMKGKRGGVTEKEKRAKKKQAKQKKNNRKIKDKERNEKSDANIHEGLQDESAMDDSDGLPSKQAKQLTTKVDTLEEGASDVPSNLDGSVEECQPDSDDKNVRPINGVNDVGSEIKNSRRGKKISSVENNSSTCLAESSTMNIMQKGNNLPESKSQISPNRGKNQRNSGIISLRSAVENLRSSIAGGSDRNTSGCGTAPKLDQETLLLSLKDKIRRLEQRLHEKEIEGRKLLKAHFEVMGTTTKAAGSSSSSSSSSSSTSSSEEPPNVLKRLEQSSETTTNCREQSSQIADRLEQSLETTTDHPEQSLETTTNHPEQSSETTADATNYAPPTKAVPVATCSPNASIPVMPTTTMKTVPVNAPTTKVESVLSKEHISNLMLQTDRAPIPSKLSPFDKVAPLPSRSPQVDKAIPAPPRSPQVDKGVSRSTELPQSSTSNSEAQEESTSTKVASVSQVVTATSRPSSAPLFPVPGSAVPSTPPIQAFPLLSRSMSEAGRLGNDPSPSAPTYVPQTYRNAIIGKPTLGTTSESLAYQPTSLGQGIALSQPLSTYTSTTSVMVPPARNDKFSGRQGFNFGLGKSEALDNWQQWKGDIDAIGNKHLWRDESPYQQTTNSNAYRHTWQDDLYQQASSSETEKLGRFGGLQPRQFRTEIPANFALQQSQGPVAEEFPHIDIINDLLEEEQSNGNMPESLHHDYHAFGLPLSSRGNFADSEMASVSSSGRFNATEHYYDDRFPRTYDSMSALHGLRDGQFSALDVYSNGRPDLIASKPWLYGSPNPSINLGINTNGFSHQLGDYTNLASRVNGDSLYRRANGHR